MSETVSTDKGLVIERLRAWAEVVDIPSGKFVNEDIAFAADLLQQQKEQIERLREALEPFADVANLIDAETEGMSETDECQLMFHDYLMTVYTVAQFRRARSSLSPSTIIGRG